MTLSVSLKFFDYPIFPQPSFLFLQEAINIPNTSSPYKLFRRHQTWPVKLLYIDLILVKKLLVIQDFILLLILFLLLGGDSVDNLVFIIAGVPVSDTLIPYELVVALKNSE